MLYDKSERYRNLAEGRTNPGTRDTVNEHKALMKAVAMDRDADKAIKLLSEHFRKTAAISLEYGLPDTEDDE
jgi:DNA-binding GntR family transcriptional regulator